MLTTMIATIAAATRRNRRAISASSSTTARRRDRRRVVATDGASGGESGSRRVTAAVSTRSALSWLGRQHDRFAVARGVGESADDVTGLRPIAIGDVDRPVEQPQRRRCVAIDGSGDECWCRHRGRRQDGAVGDQVADRGGEHVVEHPDHDPDIGCEFPGQQRRVQVCDVVLISEGDGVRVLTPAAASACRSTRVIDRPSDRTAPAGRHRPASRVSTVTSASGSASSSVTSR